jgi:hypothetical protein
LTGFALKPPHASEDSSLPQKSAAVDGWLGTKLACLWWRSAKGKVGQFSEEGERGKSLGKNTQPRTQAVSSIQKELCKNTQILIIYVMEIV